MLTTVHRIALILSLAVGVIGCGDDQSSGGNDLAMSSGGDMAHATTGGDMAMSSTGDGGLLALCAICVNNTDCASGLCQMYNNGTKKCSHSCTPTTASTDCPGVNMCNNQTPAVCRCM
jgi:hypothetical protein